MRQKIFLAVSGALTGVLAIWLALKGNPGNMGFCIACFLRDTTGALGLHRAATVQYIRPEIIGLVLGAFLAALSFREVKASGGSSPVLRFFLGMLMICGALVFLGCPLRMILRLAGGDWNALVALPGYVLGIWAGTIFLKNGFSLGRAQAQNSLNAAVSPFIALVLLVLLLAAPPFIFFSVQGPGSMKAPIALALMAGVVVGALVQRSRLCTMGAIRDLILFRQYDLFIGLAAIFVMALIGNLAAGRFSPGFSGQPIAHADWLWNFLGMTVVGLAAVLAGGCPLRQLILSGEGNTDALVTVFGMVAGAALMHNFGLASSPAGATPLGKWATVIAMAALLIVGITNVQLRKTTRVDSKVTAKG